MADINVTITTADAISVTLSGGVANNYVAEDIKFYFDGSGGNTYLVYDSSSSKLQLYVNGIKRAQWS